MSKKLEVEVSRLREVVGIMANEMDRLIERIAKLEKDNGRKAAKSNR